MFKTDAPPCHLALRTRLSQGNLSSGLNSVQAHICSSASQPASPMRTRKPKPPNPDVMASMPRGTPPNLVVGCTTTGRIQIERSALRLSVGKVGCKDGTPEKSQSAGTQHRQRPSWPGRVLTRQASVEHRADVQKLTPEKHTTLPCFNSAVRYLSDATCQIELYLKKFSCFL